MDESLSVDNSLSSTVEQAVAETRRQQNFLVEAVNSVRLFWRLMRDPEVPFYMKLMPLAALAYVIWPLDIIADIVPVLGQLDDLTAVIVGLRTFIAMVPKHVVEKHRAALANGYEKSPTPEQQVDDNIIINPDYEIRD